MLLDRDADVFLAQRPELRRGSSSHSTPCGCVKRSLQQLREIRAPRVPLEEVVVEASDDAESEPADTETAGAETVDAG